MKKISAKRVFAIIGIVMASVVGFIGAVVGVLAVMGKFKTPVVFPTVLEFEITEETIIERKTFDLELFKEDGDWEAQEATIYSFKLTGENPNEDHAVNQKDCYIWFNNISSSTLITLCDSKGKPLNKDANNRYLVQCNEPIYYMVNKVDENTQVGEIDGKVTLSARSVNETLKLPSSPKIIWIDRAVESVYVKDMGVISNVGTSKEQEITIGVEIPFDFKFSVKTPLSYKPISKESAKEIELYYNVEGLEYVTDYVRVTKEEVENVSSPLHSILTFDEESGVFKFKASTAMPSQHKFYIATFKTYEAKANYEASIEGMSIEQPNYHRLTSLDADEKPNMAVTTLTVLVKDTDISQVGLEGSNIVLDLYKTNQIYLNDDSQDNNLGLYMLRGDYGNMVEDTSRFDEVDFKAVSDHINDNKIPEFKNDDLEELEINANTKYVYTDIMVGASMYIIDYAYDPLNSNVKYYCSNGVAVAETHGTETTADDDIFMIETGSYLNFYIKTEFKSGGKVEYRPAQITFESEKIGSGSERYWNILAKSIPELLDNQSCVESLVVGILVVNNKGSFEWGNFFRTLPMTLNPIALDVDYLNVVKDFEITFENANKLNYQEFKFEDFVQVNAGSYDACVLVSPTKDNDGNQIIQIVDTINKVTFVVDQKEYVLVGYIDEKTGKFVNAVRVNENVSNANQSCNLRMLQLKNEYKQTVNDIIDPVLVDGLVLNDQDRDSKIVDLHSQSITINAEYILNLDLLNITYYDDYNPEDLDSGKTNKDGQYYTVYENTEAHKIVLSSTNEHMISKIAEFYAVNETFFNSEYENISFISSAGTGLSDDGLSFVVEYLTGSCLSDDQTPIVIKLINVGADFELGSVKVLSGSPETIVFNHGVWEYDSLVLFSEGTSDAEILNSNDYFKIVVGYKDGDYTYKSIFALDGVERDIIWKNIVEIGEYVPNVRDLFNSSTDSFQGRRISGFQDIEDKGQVLPITYDSTDLTIFNPNNLHTVDENLVEQSGTVILSVKIGSTTGYLKLVTDTSAFSVATDKNRTDFDFKKANLLLSEIVTLKYNEEPIILSEKNLVKLSDLKCVEYGDGLLEPYYDAENNKLVLRKTISEEEGTYSNILEIIDDEVVGYKFVKSNAHIDLKISLKVETVAGSKTIEISFSSNIAVEVNEHWSSNRVFYAGTNVQLLNGKITGDDNDEYEFDRNAVFSVTKQPGDTSEITFIIKNGNTGNSDNLTQQLNVVYTSTDEHIGDITIEVYINGTIAHTFFGFTVKPNIIATKKDVDLTSDTSYGPQNLYTIQQFDKTITYGGSETDLYGNYYTDDQYSEISQTQTEFFKYNHLSAVAVTSEDYSHLRMTASTGDDPQVSGGATLSIKKMTDLTEPTTRTINLLYKGYSVSLNDQFIIKNIYKAEQSLVNPTFKALKENDNFVSVLLASNDSATTFVLTDITDLTEGENAIEFEVQNGKFKIKTIIYRTFEDVDVKFTFKNEEDQILTYLTKITIDPYTPEFRASQTQAYSGSTYDLLNGIYNANSEGEDNYIAKDANILKLLVTGIYDETGANNITSEIIGGFVSSGYIQGQSGSNCEVVLKEVVGDKLDVQVEFEITYIDGKTYVYKVPMLIKNRQELKVQYPESDVEFGSAQYVVTDDKYEKEALELSGLTEKPLSEVYTISQINYESVAIYTNQPTVINLKYDEFKKISRVEVENSDSAETSNNKSLDISAELVLYQNNVGVLSYIQGRIETTTNQIVLPYAVSPGLTGMLIFKLSTKSGNYAYFNIYIYCVGESSQPLTENNLEVIYYQESIGYLNNSTGLKDKNSCEAKTNDKETTYIELIKSLKYFESTFSIVFSDLTTKVYLYEVIYTGETDEKPYVYDEKYGERWKEIVVGDKIPFDAHFNTITLGLVLNNGVEQYCYGTITIYVQPNNKITIDDVDNVKDFSYELPNGNFTAKVEASATEINSPFGTGWTANIVSIDGNLYDEDNADNIYKAEGSKIKLTKRAENDVNILVKYSCNGTIMFVDYVYIATEIPEQTSAPTYVGEFKINDPNPYFENTLDVNSEKFFGTYSHTAGYEITIGGNSLIDGGELTVNGVKISRTGTRLTFNQTNEQVTIQIKITYSKFNSTNKDRIFTFIVLPGVHLDTRDSSEISGLTNVRRAPTKATNNYANNVGSTLDITKTIVTGKYTQYSIAGLNIYTNVDSKLQLSFNEVAYVIDGNNITVEDSKVIQFVHLAEEKAIDMKIKVFNGTLQYGDERSLYLKLVQTYGTLKATYLVDGANHENVPAYSVNASGNKESIKIENLHDKLFSSEHNGESNKVRFELLDANDNKINGVDFTKMGFTISGNPNYIEFTAPENASIRTYNNGKQITFSQVTKNVLCPIYLNNNAGLVENGVYYTYQIMAGPYVDGLDYSITDGYKGDEYISFALNDVNNKGEKDKTISFTSERMIIGSMLDEENNSNFTLECEINGVAQSLTLKNIKDGKYEDKSTPIGEYQNAIQYQFTNSGYTFFITFSKDERTIELIVSRPAGTDIKDFEMVLNAGGVNGGSTLISDLTLVLSSNQIVEVYGNEYDTDIYSGYIINLFEESNDADKLYNNGKFIENGGETAPTLTYELGESRYFIGGRELIIPKGENNNNLFKYDKDKRTMETLAVGETARAEVNFLVKKGNYVIETVTYKFYVYMNFKIVVNGEDIKENENNTSPETYFVLTNKETEKDEAVKFPLTKNFVGKDSVLELSDHKVSKSDINYYDILIFDLYRLKVQNAGDSLLVQNTNVEIKLNSGDIPSDVLTVSNTGITFYKDFSGDIELLLTVNTTGNGKYQVIWTIHVSGLLTLEQITHEPIYDDALPFDSGNLINLIKNSNDKDVAIKSSSSDTFTALIERGEVKVEYSYRVIISNNETRPLSNKELYGLYGTSHYFGGSSDTIKLSSGLYAQVLLPSVPSTPADISQSYFVVLYVQVKYQEQEQEFYVAYNVVNSQNIDVHEPEKLNSANINIDERICVSGEKYFLDLLYFDETLNKDGNTYKLIYTYHDNKYQVVLKINSDKTLTIDESSEQNEKYFKDGSNLYKYIVEDNNLYLSTDSGKSYELLGTTKIQPFNEVEKKYSVFKANFNNIFAFKEFIDQYLILNKENEDETEKMFVLGLNGKQMELWLNKGILINNDTCFTLVEIKDGRFGIDLNQSLKTEYDEWSSNVHIPYKEKLNFTNELRAEIAFVRNHVKVQTVQPYSATNVQGFRLYSTHSIKPKTNNGEGINLSTMFLQSYFKDITYYEKTTDEKVVSGKHYYKLTEDTYKLVLYPADGDINTYYELKNGPTIEELARLNVIGVGTPSKDWVTNGEPVADSSKKVGEINIPGAKSSYIIKSIKYNYSGTKTPIGKDKFYTINQTYYYIDLNGNSGLYVPDYASVGIQTIFYEIAYAPNADGNVVMNLNNAVKQWTMDANGVLVDSHAKIYNVKDVTLPIEYKESTGIYAKVDYLVWTKMSTPEYTHATCDSVKLILGSENGGNPNNNPYVECTIRFALPEEIDLSVKYTSGNSDIYVQYKGPFSNSEYENLTGWKSIVDDYGYVSYNASTGKLLLNREMVKYYFDNHSEKEFYIRCVATNQNGYETILNIKVEK